MRVIVAGGGTAGHIEPALNLADELRQRHSDMQIIALGTSRGLETRLVPQRGYELFLVPAVPLPRRINADLFTLPFRLFNAIRETRALFDRWQPDVVVGFGGYVSIPAYLAARGRYPVVVHEANSKAGLANRLGARFATVVAESVKGSLTHAVLTGNPLRQSIAHLDRAASRRDARDHFGLPQDAPVLLVFGGSQGAQSINRAISEVIPHLGDVVILHSYGAKNEPAATPSAHYVPLPFIDRMDLAYAAADFALCRSGAMTVAEVSATGLPACFVPFAIGNGEQAGNALPIVSAGGALLVSDSQLSGDWIREQVLPLLHDSATLHAMSAVAKSLGRQDSAARLADLVEEVAR